MACTCEPPEWPQSGACTLVSGGNRAPAPFTLCHFQTPLRSPLDSLEKLCWFSLSPRSEVSGGCRRPGITRERQSRELAAAACLLIMSGLTSPGPPHFNLFSLVPTWTRSPTGVGQRLLSAAWVLFFFFFKKDNLYLATLDPRCNMWGLQLRHVGSGSPTRSQTRAPWMGNVDGNRGGGAQENPSRG